ncbi:unnamed protein product [Arabidopsis halleri]
MKNRGRSIGRRRRCRRRCCREREVNDKEEDKSTRKKKLGLLFCKNKLLG